MHTRRSGLGPSSVYTKVSRKGTDRLIKHGFRDFKTKDLPPLLAVTDRRLQGPLRKWCNEQVQYGHLDDSTGYLRILSEQGYTKEGDFSSGLVALEAALDTIFSDPTLKGLVIDVRINFGGMDPYGLALASRLATTGYVAYSKEARIDPVDRTKWTPGQPSFVRPSTRPGFRGPIVELTGPLTISAGETMTQALMGRSPKVLRIGENTQGVFSDVLRRTLPNGWYFGLPNEVFRSPEERPSMGRESRRTSKCLCSPWTISRPGVIPGSSGRRSSSTETGERDKSQCRLTTVCSGRRCATPLMPSVMRNSTARHSLRRWPLSAMSGQP
jgi:hypothetical protein